MLLDLIARGVKLDVVWCVLSAAGTREDEARCSAADFLSEAASSSIEVKAFRDAFFPDEASEIKSYLEDLKTRVAPDLVITHRARMTATRTTGK